MNLYYDLPPDIIVTIDGILHRIKFDYVMKQLITKDTFLKYIFPKVIKYYLKQY